MKKYKVVVTSPSFSTNEVLINELSRLNVSVRCNSAKVRFNSKELIEFVRESDADIVLAGLEKFDADVLSKLGKVCFIAKFGVGLDNLDTNWMKQHNIELGWEGGVNKRSVSELTLAFALAHFRNVFQSVERMKNGKWIKEGGVQFSNRVLGIVGLGNVGLDLANICERFGNKILYSDILDREEEIRSLGLKCIRMSFEKLIAEADIISFHVPSTESTRYMINSENVGKVKKGAFIINTARGDIVDFNSVCEAVKNKNLSGFASDVFEVEPCDLTRWRDVENLHFTPHIGGNANEAVLAMGRSAIQQIKNFIDRKSHD